MLATRLLAPFFRFAADPNDQEEVRLRKIIGASIWVSAIPTYVLYGLAYISYSERPAGFIALAGGALFALGLASYGMLRRYAAHWIFYMLTVLATLTAIHYALGGFSSSGFVLIWVLVVPLLTIVADRPRAGLVWAVAVAADIVVAALAEPYLRGGNNLPHEMVTILSALNLLGFATYMLLAIFYYVWRIDVIGRLMLSEREARMRDLEAASKHKSDFLSNMSHELRTPLNAIIGFSEVLNERMFGELNEKQGEYLKDIHASGQHLLSLINDILDLSKVEAGRMELESTEFDLPSAIENALILVSERATRRGITLGRSIDERLEMIRADERKVKQVLLNLLSNALKFTPEGGRIDVTARLHDDVAEISVADTGVGIAPKDQEAVFEEFRQVGTAAQKVEGTGLGLALARKFIELHGGRIWVKSQLGAGSTFTFTLPLRR